MHIYIYIYIYIHTYIYTHICICVYVCVYVCVYICIYVYIHTYVYDMFYYIILYYAIRLIHYRNTHECTNDGGNHVFGGYVFHFMNKHSVLIMSIGSISFHPFYEYYMLGYVMLLFNVRRRI